MREHDPQLIVCPFLKQMIPESIWSAAPLPDCPSRTTRRPWTVFAGLGDRAGERDWGVTVLEANGELDAGACVGDTRLRDAARRGRPAFTGTRSGTPRSKDSSKPLRRIIEDDDQPPEEQRSLEQGVSGRARPLMSQSVRAIDWDVDRTETVIRKIRAAEGHPGVLDDIEGTRFHLFGGTPNGCCAVRRARSSRSGPARYAARPSTVRSGSRSSSARTPQPSGTSSFRLRARFRWPASRSTCRRWGCRSPPPRLARETYREITYVERGRHRISAL